MAEYPNFEKIAAQILEPLVLALDRQRAELPPGQYGVVKLSIAEQLRLVWNARGAADITASNAVTGEFGFDIPSAIRSLDVESRASVREP